MPIICPDINCTSNQLQPVSCLQSKPCIPHRQVLHRAPKVLQISLRLSRCNRKFWMRLTKSYSWCRTTNPLRAGQDWRQLCWPTLSPVVHRHGLSPTGFAVHALWQDSSTGVMCFRPTTWELLSVHLAVEPHKGGFSRGPDTAESLGRAALGSSGHWSTLAQPEPLPAHNEALLILPPPAALPIVHVGAASSIFRAQHQPAQLTTASSTCLHCLQDQCDQQLEQDSDPSQHVVSAAEGRHWQLCSTGHS